MNLSKKSILNVLTKFAMIIYCGFEIPCKVLGLLYSLSDFIHSITALNEKYMLEYS